MNIQNTVLSLKNISKLYPGVVALNDFSVDFCEGEIHALVGENGAGKSTLIKIIAGATQPEAGKICFGDQEFAKMTPHTSRALGVEVIYQEYNLIESLSAAENICLGERYGRFVDQKKMIQKAKEIFSKFNMNINPQALVKNLPSAQQQIIEIAKAVSKNARIIIMDEPTAPLSVSEVECLFNIVEQLKKQGVTIIYVSHRMEEIFRIADRVTVLRDGCYIATKNTKNTNRKELISLMVGRELIESFPKRKHELGDVTLEIKNLTGNGVQDISFSVRKGEILGISGLVGSGRTELIRVIYGAEPKEKGEVLVEGKVVNIKSPKDAIELGIGLIPEDRKHQGVFLEMDVKWNISFTNLRNISNGTVVNKKAELDTALKYEAILGIKTPNLNQRVKNLSGGNQQKVVIAKTLAANSSIIFFDEPTLGIDVGAKQEIYYLMNKLVASGKTIVMISSDMEELLGMSDKIVVLSEGNFAGVVQKDQFNQNHILDLASGNG